MPTPPVLQGPGPGFGWGKKPPTGGAGRPGLGGKCHHAAGVFSVQMASKKGGRRAPPCSWTNARMGGSPVEPILVQGMTCAWCVGEGGAPHKSRPKAVPPAKGGLSRARGPRGVVHRGATTCKPFRSPCAPRSFDQAACLQPSVDLESLQGQLDCARGVKTPDRRGRLNCHKVCRSVPGERS